MKQFVVVAFAFGLLMNVSGCGGMKGESEVKEMIKVHKDAKAAAEKDPAKALEHLGKMMEAAQKLAAVKLTDEEAKKLFDKYKSDLEPLGVKDYKDLSKPMGDK